MMTNEELAKLANAEDELQPENAVVEQPQPAAMDMGQAPLTPENAAQPMDAPPPNMYGSETNAQIKKYLDPQVMDQLHEKAVQKAPLGFTIPAAILGQGPLLGSVFNAIDQANWSGPAAAAGNEINYRMKLADELRKKAMEDRQEFRMQREDARKQGEFDDKHEIITKLKDLNHPLTRTLQNMAMQLDPEHSETIRKADGNELMATYKQLGYLGGKILQNTQATNKLAEMTRHHKTMESKATTKDSQLLNTLSQKFGEDLDPMKMRGGALSIEARKSNLAKHLEALATNQEGEIKDLSSIPMEEISIGLANMLSGGGVAAQAVIKNVKPHTATGSIQEMASYLLNNPEPLHQKEFVKMFYDASKRQAQISDDIIKDAQIKRLTKHKLYREMDPEGFNAQLDAYDIVPDRDIDEHGRYKKASTPKTETQAPKKTKQVVKTLVSPSTGKKKVIYNDGTSEIQ